MNRAVIVAIALFAGWLANGANAQEVSGGLETDAAYTALRDTVFLPDANATLADYMAIATARVSVTAGDLSRATLQATASVDSATGALTASVLRAYAEARLSDIVALSLGRQPIGFGSGLLWNPANNLDPTKNPLDREAARSGVDATRLTLDWAAITGFPLSLSIEGVAPPWRSGVNLTEGTVAAQLYAYVGGAELSIVGDCADLAGKRPRWSAGAWGTYDLGGVVTGFEVVYRKSDRVPTMDATGLPVADNKARLAALVTVSIRAGDSFAFIETLYNDAAMSPDDADRIGAMPPAWAAYVTRLATPGNVGRLHMAAGVQWSVDPLTLGTTLLFNAESQAGAAHCTMEYAVDDAAVIRLETMVPVKSGTTSEYDFSPYAWTVGFGIDVFF